MSAPFKPPRSPASSASNLTPVAHRVAAARRRRRNGHAGGVLWLTGLSGAGKSTLAFALEEQLFQDGFQVYVLDGDNVRQGLNADLGFSHADRVENVRRVGEVAALFADAGVLCISAFISPYERERAAARRMAPDHFHEVYIRARLATCEKRDPKGLYKRARAGEIHDFTAIDDVYEAPTAPALVVDTDAHTIVQCLAMLRRYVADRFGVPSSRPARKRR